MQRIRQCCRRFVESLAACGQEVGRRWWFVPAMLAGLLPHGGAAHASTARGATHAAPAVIEIVPQGWGTTSLDALQEVLDDVVDVVGRHFPDRRLGRIRVFHGEPGPLVLYDKGDAGDYQVRLSARDGRWHQFVYQFSHELCHIYSNFDNKSVGAGDQVARGNQWFEESVCEAAALYTLRQLAAQWRSRPPAAGLDGGGDTLAALADYLLNESHRRLSRSDTPGSWFRAHETELHANPYLRDRNELVSNLLLPMFERDPSAWAAIAYLNSSVADADARFADYLAAWRRACPSAQRQLVEQIIALFALEPAPALLLAADN